jgi:nucleotide-binding universal stress UspA family protein
MRRVLVPLDGSVFAESIIPDARRLAGTDGELILVRDARLPLLDRDIFVDSTMLAVEDSEWYLHHEAEKLREEGVNCRSQSFVLADAASAIDESARIFKADIIAVATHGRGPLSRLWRGSVAWRAVAHSPVPVLLRHVDDPAASPRVEEGDRRILVPLDGSSYAEKALPMAQELALEWNAPVWLVQVVTDVPVMGSPYAWMPPLTVADETGIRDAHVYLQGVADRLPGQVHVHAARGPVVDTLVHDIERLSITDVVVASHGRTGLSRVILGSIADEMIHVVHCPIIVVPVLEEDRPKEQTVHDDQSSTVKGVADNASQR